MSQLQPTRTKVTRAMAPASLAALGSAGLGPAVNAIRTARAAKNAPMVTGQLPAGYGATVPIMSPTNSTALQALRALAGRHPHITNAIRYGTPGAIGTQLLGGLLGGK
jgi:hypothetical protein